MTQSWLLTVKLCKSGFSALFDRLITKLWKTYFLCTFDDQMKILYRFCFKHSFTKFSLVFFPLFSNVFTNICKIYELPKRYNKKPKHSQTLVLMIIYQVNAMPKVSFFVASDVVPNVYKKPWRLLSSNEIIPIWNTWESVS